MTNHEREWLAQLDALPLECDGLTRIVSSLLTRDGIAHQVMMGQLTVPGAGHIPLHCWTELDDGRRIDLRARMWLGNTEDVPHGVIPESHNSLYEGQPLQLTMPSFLFPILTGKKEEDFASASFLLKRKIPLP